MLVNPEISIYYQKRLQKRAGMIFEKWIFVVEKHSDEQDIVFLGKTVYAIAVLFANLE